MKQMVMMVLNNPDHCTTLLEAWDAAGAPGITILESTGLINLRQAGLRDDLPLMPSLVDVLRGKEERHRTIFSVVEDEAAAQALVAATEAVFRQLEEQNQDESGILFVVPVAETHRFATTRAQRRLEGQR